MKKIMDVEIRDTQICNCICHMKGNNILHIIPCCDVYMSMFGQYIDKNGNIDYILWGKAKREIYEYRRKQGLKE